MALSLQLIYHNIAAEVMLIVQFFFGQNNGKSSFSNLRRCYIANAILF